MAGKDKIDISVVANLKDPVEGIDLLSQKTQDLSRKLEGLQRILTKLETVKPGKEFAALMGASGQSLLQVTAPSGRSGIDNTFIAQIQRQQERDMKNSLDVIQASMKRLADNLSKLIKDSTDEARQASTALADARRLRNVAKVNGRTGEEIFRDEQAEREERAARALRAQQLRDDRRRAREEGRFRPLSQEEIDSSVSRRFQLSAGARSFQGGAPLLEERFRTFADYATIGTTVGAVVALTKGIVDLDKEMRQFQAITNTSNTEMRGFERNLLNLATTSKFSAVELAQVATALGQAGLTAVQVGPALDAVQKLAAASGSTLKEAGDLVTSTIGVFNVQGSEVANIANTFTAALNLTKLTMDKLTLGFQYASNVARDLGISYTELTAALGTLSNSGIRSGSTLGTGFRQLLIDLQTPTEKAKQTFARLGITLDDINVKTHGLTGVLENLRAKGFTTADAFEALEVRAVTAFSALTAGIEQTRRLEQQLLLSSAAGEALNVQMQSFSAQAARLYNAISVLVYRAFKPLLDALTTITSALATLFGEAAKLETLLGVGGTLFGVAAMGLIISRMVSFTQSLFAMASGYSAIATQARGAAAGAAMYAAASGAGAIATRGAAVVGGLGGGLAAAAGGPVGLAITAAAVGVGALAYFGSGSNSNLDKAQAQLSDAQGKYDATTTAITRLRDEMGKLIDRQTELDKNDQARLTRIFELRKAFGDLGISISDSAKSTAELIASLQRLDKQLNIRALAESQLRISARERKLSEMEAEFNSQLRINQNSLGRAGGPAADVIRAAIGSVRPTAGMSNNEFYTEQLNAINRLLQENAANQSMTAQLQPIKTAIVALLQRGSSLDAERLALRNDRQDQTGLEYQRLSRVTGLTDRVTAANADIGSRRSEIEKIIDPVARDKATRELEQYARETFMPLLEARAILIQEMQRTADPETRRRLEEIARQNEVGEEMAKAIASILLVRDASKKIVKEINLLLINGQIDRLNAEINQSQSRSRSTNNQQTILEMGAKVQDLIRQRIELELKKLQEEKGNDPQIAPAYLEALRNEIKQKGDAELNRAATQTGETLREVQRNLLRQTDALADRQLSTLATQQRILQDRMKDPNITAEQMRKLQDEFNKIVEQREAIIRGQNERARILNPERGGFVPLPGAKAEAFAVASALGEYGTRIGSLETGGTFNPNARNTSSGAYGLFQFLPSTLAGKPGEGLGGLSSNNEALRKLLTDAGITDSRQLDEALKTGRITIPVQLQIELMRQFTDQNRAALGALGNNPENLALAHFLGAGGAKKLLEALARNPNEQALGNGIGALGLSQNGLPADASVSRVRDFYLNLYRNRNISNIGTSEGQLREQQAQDRENQEKLEQIRKSIENSNTALDNARKLADQRLAQARTGVRAAQEGMAAGNASEGDIEKAQRELRLAQLNQYSVELNANLKEQQNIREQISRQVGEDTASAERRQTLQNYLNTLLNKEKELRTEINIADRANVRTPIDSGALTQTYLQRQGYLTRNNEINGKGMIERGYLDTLSALDTGFQNFFKTLASGELTFENLGKAAKAFGLSIISSMMNIISKRLGEMLINSLFGSTGAGGGNLLTSFFSALFGGGGGSTGTAIGFANGTLVRAATGIGIPNRDSVNALLMPGEAVLRASAVTAIGEENVVALNNQGNRKLDTPFSEEAQESKEKKDNIVNVWLVEREAMPPLGEKDIVHIIGSDLDKRGATYQLVKQIQMGAK